MAMTPKEMKKLLEQNGFVCVSQNGSHLKMWKKSTNKSVILPMHCKDLKIGLEHAIKKQAGI